MDTKDATPQDTSQPATVSQTSVATAPPSLPAPSAQASPLKQAVIFALILALVMCLQLIAFIAPSAKAEASGLRIGITGETALLEQVRPALENGLKDRATLENYPDREALTQAIKERKAEAGLVIDASKPEVLTASAAGQAIGSLGTQLTAAMQKELNTRVLEGIKAGIAQAQAQAQVEMPAKIAGLLAQIRANPQMLAALPADGSLPPQLLAQLTAGDSPAPETPGVPPTASNLPDLQLPQVTLTDVVPVSDTDPLGIGITLTPVPLTIAGLIGGIAVFFLFTTLRARLLMACVYALAYAGLGILVLNTWLGVYPGNAGAVFVAMTSSIFTTTCLFIALATLLKHAGLALGVVITIFMGLPWAGLALPPQFLPSGLGDFGQYLLPGATTTLMRNLGYFPDADATFGWLVILGWLLAAGLLIGLAVLRGNRAVSRAGSKVT